jgi:hypothetical protein
MWLRGRQDPDERDHATQIAVRTHVKELPTTPRQAMLGRWRGATLDSRPKETAAGPKAFFPPWHHTVLVHWSGFFGWRGVPRGMS